MFKRLLNILGYVGVGVICYTIGANSNDEDDKENHNESKRKKIQK